MWGVTGPLQECPGAAGLDHVLLDLLVGVCILEGLRNFVLVGLLLFSKEAQPREELVNPSIPKIFFWIRTDSLHIALLV